MKHDDRTTRAETIGRGTTDSPRATATGGLSHLGDLDDYKIADGEPDIRGWDVKGADGRRLGEVADLLVDTGAMKVRYVEVELDDDAANAAARTAGGADARAEAARRVLVPIGVARLDDEHDDLHLDADATRLVGLPAYRRDGVTREYETGLLRGYDRDGGMQADVNVGPGTEAASADDDFYAGSAFNDRTFFGRRRRGRDDATYFTRSGE